jgi:hypothetical protein
MNETYVVCKTTGRKLDPNTLLPIEDVVSFESISVLGDNIVKCEKCGILGAYLRRQNTQYLDDESNYITLCDPCQEENNEYWSDMWRDYYSGCL